MNTCRASSPERSADRRTRRLRGVRRVVHTTMMCVVVIGGAVHVFGDEAAAAEPKSPCGPEALAGPSEMGARYVSRIIHGESEKVCRDYAAWHASQSYETYWKCALRLPTGPGFDRAARVPLAVAESASLVEQATDFLGATAGTLENRLHVDTDRARRDGVVNERRRLILQQRDEWPSGDRVDAFRLSTPLDVNNDGQIDSVVFWTDPDRRCGGDSDVVPGMQMQSRHLLVLDQSGKVDYARSRDAMGVRLTRDGVLLSNWFSAFAYEGETYVDAVVDREALRENLGAIARVDPRSAVLGLVRTRGSESELVCAIAVSGE